MSAANYFRTPEMQTGKGFRCFNCGKLLAVKLRGNFEVSFRCPRCKAYIFIKMGEKIPWVPLTEEQKKEDSQLQE
ncbi:MAG: hypothetical protein K6T87_16140 [Roseiflexus sp.]|uniref:hypothetical protein n=1 Tax=Roseiflexus sp. TaxID=2562120 RepID=UPI002600BD9B|nr:hypothetical protein [Roseiflexus sp.]MCL6542087.1 hypothetical protein [Roseiflexus sp.]